MDRSYEMKWSKLTGTIKGERGVATCEMMDLPNAFWHCKFYRADDSEIEVAVQAFPEGQLQEANAWCEKQVKEHDERSTK